MKWDEMSPRERDVLVAEKVMHAAQKSDGLLVRNSDGTRCFIDGWQIGGTWYSSVPRYTTDISTAWEVVEMMQAKQVSVEIKHWSYPNAKWIAEIGEEFRVATTAPEAICRAALRAVGVDV